MPHKAKSGSRVAVAREDGAQAGYFMYSDGSSNWGVGVWRGGETPLRIDADNAKEIHLSKQKDKVAWYKEKQIEIAEAAKEAKK